MPIRDSRYFDKLISLLFEDQMNLLKRRLYSDCGEVGNAKTNSFPIGARQCEGRMTKEKTVSKTQSLCNHG